ncbi:uncharacterized protein A1O5_04026 [Cladophialophora psammophila CBS 110553]|uniref:4-coumarate-CoA ligase n=1 Tax=Cladophialophora psammophila CBS 110553 TaxID=1182543 RepID=W9WY78_9EURO|nr:uncharacterized protein A1O5_04026 [Cladophialophora psammophila CBS 110553]EXJ72878.1 hypothetical protein A1O5_04026 [Cladophialophora psammophila CBS 110553]
MPFQSLLPPIDIPDADIWEFLFERPGRAFPDHHIILTDSLTKAQHTFGEIRTDALQFAKTLKSRYGWNKGDVLAIYSPNCAAMSVLIWGCLAVGGVVSTINPSYNAEELTFQIQDTRARLIAVYPELVNTVREAIREFKLDMEILLLDQATSKECANIPTLSSVLDNAVVSKEERSTWRKSIVPSQDLAFLIYSSGTTGRPKGVMLTHRNIVANILQISSVEGPNLSWEADKVLGFLPLYHIYGLTCLLHRSLYSGVPLVIMPKFDLEAFCSLVMTHKVTYAYVAPPVLVMLSKHPIVTNFDLSSLRMMNSGAAPLTRELVENVYTRLNLRVKQGYGLTETSPTTHLQLWSDWNNPIGSVGQLLPNMTAKIMLPDGKEAPLGEAGEIWLRGPNIFKGYFRNDIATKDSLTSDGYFKTGDVGYQNSMGLFFITDRLKELIKYNGFQVPPAELEGILISHPKVSDVATLGIYDKERATEIPCAFGVPTDGVVGDALLAKEIVQWLAKRVAPHKRLRGGFHWVEAIPKSAAGKILRKDLRLLANEIITTARPHKL